MTRKDYVLIAEAISYYQHYRNETERQIARGVARELANALATDNPKFNRGRFLDACEPRP